MVAHGGGTASGVGTASEQILGTWYDWTVSPPTETYAYTYDQVASMASPAPTPDQIATAPANGAALPRMGPVAAPPARATPRSRIPSLTLWIARS